MIHTSWNAYLESLRQRGLLAKKKGEQNYMPPTKSILQTIKELCEQGINQPGTGTGSSQSDLKKIDDQLSLAESAYQMMLEDGTDPRLTADRMKTNVHEARVIAAPHLDGISGGGAIVGDTDVPIDLNR